MVCVLVHMYANDWCWICISDMQALKQCERKQSFVWDDCYLVQNKIKFSKKKKKKKYAQPLIQASVLGLEASW
jgi:hypothetical protein